MEFIKKHRAKLPYAVFAVLGLFSLCLAFSGDLWFDEAYTVSLIRHDFGEVVDILKTDMHPPLYFLSLKLFCSVFGYSLAVTKIFSALGYLAMLSLGLTIVKKHYGARSSIVYMLTVGAVPMALYFSVQQRSYQWCIFFVTLCFLKALLFLETRKPSHCVLFVIAGLGAAYNHIYALLAVGVVFAFVNVYALAKDRKLFKFALISDAAMIAGFSPWLIQLLNQTKAASGSFWLTGVEPLSVIVFASGLAFSALILAKKENRRPAVVFAIVCVLSVQAIGLFVTVFIRPFYIARYCVVTLGVFALLIAFGVRDVKKRLKKFVLILLCVLNVACFAVTATFEYSASMSSFFDRLDKRLGANDTFVYCDSSFGIMSYYYPEHEHICTYNEAWFAAFENVECIEKDEVGEKVGFGEPVWLVKNAQTRLPDYIKSSFTAEKVDSFRCDFNYFELYSLSKR